VSQVEIAHLVLKLLKIEPAYTIAIDRTEWQFGTQWVNVLMLSVTYQSVSIPLFWTVSAAKGCSDNAERKAILQKFIDDFGVESIRFVTADREFCSKDWLEFLIANQIPYRLRIKANYQITNVRGALVRASRLCRTLKTGDRRELRGKRLLWNQSVLVAVCRKADGDNVPVVSNEQSGKILLEFGERWKIETLFGIWGFLPIPPKRTDKDFYVVDYIDRIFRPIFRFLLFGLPALHGYRRIMSVL